MRSVRCDVAACELTVRPVEMIADGGDRLAPVEGTRDMRGRSTLSRGRRWLRIHGKLMSESSILGNMTDRGSYGTKMNVKSESGWVKSAWAMLLSAVFALVRGGAAGAAVAGRSRLRPGLGDDRLAGNRAATPAERRASSMLTPSCISAP